MQNDPLLEQLDWFFTSVNWTVYYPNTLVLPLAKITSDHILCKVMIGTRVPKSNLFRFENFWPNHPGFLEAVQRGLAFAVRNQRDSASIVAGKIKNVRYELKVWSRKLSNLSRLIDNYNKVIFFLDDLEDHRVLQTLERNFRSLIKEHLQTLLKFKTEYWRKRYTVQRIKLGDECTKFFHAMATVSFRRNTITQLKNDQGQIISDHDGRTALLWIAYRNRMGITSSPVMSFDLSSLIHLNLDFSSLIAPFSVAEIDKVISSLLLDKAPGQMGSMVCS